MSACVIDCHFQANPAAATEKGYWSWMDGQVNPITTPYKGSSEALTVTVAFFPASGGWFGPGAMAKRQGATWVQEMQTAVKSRPRFLLVNQWNEFAGQPEAPGQSYAE